MVEVAGGVTVEKNRFRAKILDGETKGVKLNITGIITSKGTYRNQIFVQIRGSKDIVKFERRKGCGNESMRPMAWTGSGAPFPTMMWE
jgi:hypothetical protein